MMKVCSDCDVFSCATSAVSLERDEYFCNLRKRKFYTAFLRSYTPREWGVATRRMRGVLVKRKFSDRHLLPQHDKREGGVTRIRPVFTVSDNPPV